MRGAGFSSITFLQAVAWSAEIPWLRQHTHAGVQEPGTPAIDLGGGGSFQPRGAWDDLSRALEGAQKLIYIVGWSIYTNITLVRDPGNPMHPSEAPTLGAQPLQQQSPFTAYSGTTEAMGV